MNDLKDDQEKWTVLKYIKLNKLNMRVNNSVFFRQKFVYINEERN